jgi:hypothetical protein
MPNVERGSCRLTRDNVVTLPNRERISHAGGCQPREPEVRQQTSAADVPRIGDMNARSRSCSTRNNCPFSSCVAIVYS